MLTLVLGELFPGSGLTHLVPQWVTRSPLTARRRRTPIGVSPGELDIAVAVPVEEGADTSRTPPAQGRTTTETPFKAHIVHRPEFYQDVPTPRRPRLRTPTAGGGRPCGPSLGAAMLWGMVRYRVRVSGRVQGVWYRETCRRVADEAGVAGWVRNNGDGTVEAVLEGEPPAVERVVAWMRTGPRRAVVTGVETQLEPPRGEQGFSVG